MPDHPLLHIVVSSEAAIIRRGLASLAQNAKGVELVGEAQSLHETQHLCQRLEPELLILHSQESEAALAIALKELHEDQPGMHILLVIDHLTADQAAALTHNDRLWMGMPGSEQFACLSLQASEADFARSLQQFGARRARHPSTPLARSSSSMAQELAMAGRIQANILPESVPVLPGWDIAARLLPARETSGDFYDFIPVSERSWGIVIADVADKGMGAALFMTLTSTLFRGLAARHPTLPGLTLDTVNERILSDTRGSMFVTAFFGVLEPHTGRLRYANAGHPPPLLIKSQKGKPVDRLVRTGMALGIEADEHWTQKMVSISPGDVLVLYTDGVIEAMNTRGQQFDFIRLQDVVVRQAARPAKSILDAVLTEVYRFTANGDRAAHSFADDTALIVLKRKE